jgi:hypothetical protein
MDHLGDTAKGEIETFGQLAGGQREVVAEDEIEGQAGRNPAGDGVPDLLLAGAELTQVVGYR